MSQPTPISAWYLLTALSAATAALSHVPTLQRAPSVAAAALLTLAGCKAHIILARYLHLSHARCWLRAFDGALCVLLGVAWGLCAIAARGTAQ